MLVLADNLCSRIWAGRVWHCSYLVIGFYYQNRANGRAAIKAFTVTRVGDVFLAIGLFLLFVVFGTLDMAAINAKADAMFAVNDPMLLLIVAMLIGGAFGKSAQIPLHTWLADTWGPTPVSALIHAATMVTAGGVFDCPHAPFICAVTPRCSCIGWAVLCIVHTGGKFCALATNRH